MHQRNRYIILQYAMSYLLVNPLEIVCFINVIAWQRRNLYNRISKPLVGFLISIDVKKLGQTTISTLKLLVETE